ncbi:hypothetical protein KKH13_04770, partial [Patescibacteria group bacterium]|nr:hypothetical protein [Patescibacteria group bacterium]
MPNKSVTKIDLINRLSSKFKSYAKGEIGEVASREEIRKIIAHYGQLTSCYPDKRHLLAGEKTFIS